MSPNQQLIFGREIGPAHCLSAKHDSDNNVFSKVKLEPGEQAKKRPKRLTSLRRQDVKEQDAQDEESPYFKNNQEEEKKHAEDELVLGSDKSPSYDNNPQPKAKLVIMMASNGSKSDVSYVSGAQLKDTPAMTEDEVK